MRAILYFASMYFSLVFAAGFALGMLRVLMVVPLLGERHAELLELPLMIAVSIYVSRWLVSRGIEKRAEAAMVGLLALLLVFMAELGVLVFIRNQAISQYLTERDPVAGSAYLLALLLFAAMPLICVGFEPRQK